MGKMSIADRVKEGPLLPKWKQIVAKNKGLADLKGDVDGDLAEYDKNLKAAGDADTAQQKAWQSFISATASSFDQQNKIIDSHMDAFAKLKNNAYADWKKRSGNCDKLAKTDVPKAMDGLSELVDNATGSLGEFNDIFKGVTDARQTLADTMKKAYASSRKQVDDGETQRKKLEDACNALEDSVRKTVGDMQKQAIKLSQDKLATVLDGFLKSI